MADYIEREAAVKIAEKFGLACGSVLGRHTGIADCIAQEIASLPTADVAPVRRGTWIIGRGTDNFDIKCSECGYTDIFGVCGVREVKIEAKSVHYCPNCGAKMDGGL